MPTKAYTQLSTPRDNIINDYLAHSDQLSSLLLLRILWYVSTILIRGSLLLFISNMVTLCNLIAPLVFSKVLLILRFLTSSISFTRIFTLLVMPTLSGAFLRNTQEVSKNCQWGMEHSLSSFFQAQSIWVRVQGLSHLGGRMLHFCFSFRLMANQRGTSTYWLALKGPQLEERRQISDQLKVGRMVTLVACVAKNSSSWTEMSVMLILWKLQLSGNQANRQSRLRKQPPKGRRMVQWQIPPSKHTITLYQHRVTSTTTIFSVYIGPYSLLLSHLAMLRVCKRLFSTLRVQKHFVQPPPLLVIPSPSMPQLQTNQSKNILTHAWAQMPFTNQQLMAPVFSLTTGGYSGETIQLRSDIFNQPIRRDLIYRLYQWRINLNKFRTHKTRTVSEISGSGKKPRPQKGQGRARLGNLRAPGRYKGAKIHGPKPRVYSFHLNEKIKLKALKSLLSCKLAEGKIRIVDSEFITEGKTRLVYHYLSQHLPSNCSICFVTSVNVDPNFEKAQRNLEYVKWHNSEDFDVLDILKCDRLVITRQGLQQLALNISKSEYMIFRHPFMKPLEESQQSPETPSQEYDPSKPVEFKFRILQEYLQLFEKAKEENKERLEEEILKVKKVTQYSRK